MAATPSNLICGTLKLGTLIFEGIADDGRGRSQVILGSRVWTVTKAIDKGHWMDLRAMQEKNPPAIRGPGGVTGIGAPAEAAARNL